MRRAFDEVGKHLCDAERQVQEINELIQRCRAAHDADPPLASVPDADAPEWESLCKDPNHALAVAQGLFSPWEAMKQEAAAREMLEAEVKAMQADISTLIKANRSLEDEKQGLLADIAGFTRGGGASEPFLISPSRAQRSAAPRPQRSAHPVQDNDAVVRLRRDIAQVPSRFPAHVPPTRNEVHGACID